MFESRKIYLLPECSRKRSASAYCSKAPEACNMVRPLRCNIVLLWIVAAILLAVTCVIVATTTSSRSRTQESTEAQRSNPGPQLILFLGLEGTGHHWIQQLFQASPFAAKLNTLGVTTSLVELEHALFSSSGLLFLPCESQQLASVGNPCPLGDVDCAFQRVVDLLSSIRKSVPSEITSIPLNRILYTASYPQDLDYCRPLKYPNLDVMYAACRVARVRCGHIYLHRDPQAILESTVVKRRFNSGIMAAVVQYRTMLNVLYAQLFAHSNQTIACMDLLSGATGDFAPHSRVLQDLFGWSSRTDFETALSHLFRPTPSLPEKERSNLVDPKYKVYMHSFVESNEAVLRLCQEQVERKPPTSL